MSVTGADVAAFLGTGEDERFSAAVDLVYALAWGYTRGNGFTLLDEGGEPNGEIRAVIVAAAARLAANPEQVDTTVGSVSTRGGFAGWTLAELSVLNRYRVRAL